MKQGNNYMFIFFHSWCILVEILPWLENWEKVKKVTPMKRLLSTPLVQCMKISKTSTNNYLCKVGSLIL